MNRKHVSHYLLKYAVGMCFLGLMCSYSSKGLAQKADAFRLQQGVNIGDWLSQKANVSFKEKDVEMLSALQFDHVRLPVDECQLFNTDGSKNAESFVRLHTALGWIEKHHMKAVVDLHIIKEHDFGGGAESFIDDFEDGIVGKWKPNSSSGIKVEVVDNPDATGSNKSQKVLHVSLTENSNWKGTERKEVNISVGSSQFKYLRFKVRKSKTGYITFKFEAEDGTTAYLGYDVKVKDRWIEADVSPYHKLEGKKITRITIRPDNEMAELWIDDVAFSSSHSSYKTAVKQNLWSSVEAQQHFIGLWKQLQSELKRYPEDLLAYELLNEPTAPTAANWNRLAAKTLAEIRKEEPLRKVVIGSNLWNNVKEFSHLEVPSGDKNIILTFHFYNPHLITHYQASWLSAFAHLTVPIQYPGLAVTDDDFNALSPADQAAVASEGRTFDKAILKTLMKQAIDKARSLGLQVWCGEFGCYNRTPRQSRLKWLEDVAQICREYGIGHCLWNFQGGFGFVTPEVSKVNDAYIVNAQTDWERLNIASLKNNPAVKAYATDNNSGTYGADKAIDGTYNTRWGAGKNVGECDWWVDLGRIYAVNMICPLWENYAKLYEIYVATEANPDGTPQWSTTPVISQKKHLGEYRRTYVSNDIAAGSYFPDPHVLDAPVKARYIKLKQLKSGSSSWGASLWEMHVLGTPDGPTTHIDQRTGCHQTVRSADKDAIYTLQGIRVPRKQLAGTIYIQGGKKYVVR